MKTNDVPQSLKGIMTSDHIQTLNIYKNTVISIHRYAKLLHKVGLKLYRIDIIEKLIEDPRYEEKFRNANENISAIFKETVGFPVSFKYIPKLTNEVSVIKLEIIKEN